MIKKTFMYVNREFQEMNNLLKLYKKEKYKLCQNIFGSVVVELNEQKTISYFQFDFFFFGESNFYSV
jgi:hypothetical protein